MSKTQQILHIGNTQSTGSGSSTYLFPFDGVIVAYAFGGLCTASTGTGSAYGICALTLGDNSFAPYGGSNVLQVRNDVLFSHFVPGWWRNVNTDSPVSGLVTNFSCSGLSVPIKQNSRFTLYLNAASANQLLVDISLFLLPH